MGGGGLVVQCSCTDQIQGVTERNRSWILVQARQEKVQNELKLTKRKHLSTFKWYWGLKCHVHSVLNENILVMFFVW